jgi:hypothetical protein
VTERPQNVRPARSAERTHNSHRYQSAEGGQTATAVRAYRGSHRAERMHRADDRTSRVGRHHVDSLPQDHQNRW